VSRARAKARSASAPAGAKAGRSAQPDDAARLALDAAVYSAEAIDRTRRAFAHLADIEVRKTGRRWDVRFSNVAPAAAGRLADEFANHALSCVQVTG
jgi:hypothetical protein